VEPSRLDRLWAKAAAPTPVNPSTKSLINLTEDLYIQHLLPGKSFRKLASKLEWNMTKLMSWDELSNRFSLNVDGRGLSEAISPQNLCGDVLIDVTQISLFDPVLFKLDPGMTKDMQFFTDELWKLLYPAPGISSTKVATLRERYTNTFLKYMNFPHNARKEEASLITTLVDQYKELDISEHDSAAMLVMVYWA
jgi:hypothetical protein